MTRGRFIGIALAAILALAGVLRCALAVFTFSSTRDTSVVGLMGLHILDGARPLFFSGQAYMGALEAYGAALVFRLFGASPETLAVTPIAFGVAWAAATFFLFRKIFGDPAGLSSALYIACAGFSTAWFTMGAYGGYPEIYFMGTMALLLVLRLTDTSAPDWSPLSWLCLGLLFGVGLWTNLQVLPYFMLSGAILALDWFYKRRTKKRALAIVFACLVALVGLLPSYLISQDVAGLEHMALDVSLTAGNVSILLSNVLGRMIWWPATENLLLRCVVAMSLAIPFSFYLLSLWQKRHEPRRLIPLFFALLFLSMYLPHELASRAAPRYLISSFMMLACAGFATLVTSGRRKMRISGWLCVAIWSVYNISALVDYCAAMYPHKHNILAVRERITGLAQRANLQNIKIVGGPSDGLLGANLSFFSQDTVHVIAAQDDRFLNHHLAWHADQHGAYAFRPYWRKHVQGALEAMAVRGAVFSDADFFVLLHGLEPQFSRQKSIPYTIAASGGVEGNPATITDLSLSSSVKIEKGRTVMLTLALNEPRLLDGLRLFPVDGESLPEGQNTVAVSMDGVNYLPVVTTTARVAGSYVSGNRVYLMDHSPAQDYRWSTRKAQFLRLTFENTSRRKNYEISELLLFEHLGSQHRVEEKEVVLLAEYMKSRKISFAWCDRWLSSRLSGLSVPPPPNARYRKTVLSGLVALRSDHAIVVENRVADLSYKLLQDALPESAVIGSTLFEHYTVLTVDNLVEPVNTSNLIWNGHMILKK